MPWNGPLTVAYREPILSMGRLSTGCPLMKPLNTRTSTGPCNELRLLSLWRLGGPGPSSARSLQHPMRCHIYIYLQDGQDILLGSGANLTAEQASMNLGNTTIPSWWQVNFTQGDSDSCLNILWLRRGANTTNDGLNLVDARGTPKGKKQGMQFPVLQCGADPVSTLHAIYGCISQANSLLPDILPKQSSTAFALRQVGLVPGSCF